jgi:beta propeller repeat protein
MKAFPTVHEVARGQGGNEILQGKTMQPAVQKPTVSSVNTDLFPQFSAPRCGAMLCAVAAALLAHATMLPAGAAETPYRLTGFVSRLTTNAAAQGNACIHGSFAAWIQWASDNTGDADIYLCELATGQARKVTGVGGQYQSALSDTKLAFTDDARGNRNGDIMVYDLLTGQTVRLESPGEQGGPHLSGNRIVYNDWRHNNQEVYLCDLTTMTETRLTDSPATQGGPHISGDKIVWTDLGTGAGDVMLLDLGTGVLTNVTQHPAYDGQSGIDGDIIVFVSRRDAGIPNIYYHRLSVGETVQVTRASGLGAYDVHVSGDYISYFEHDPESNRYNIHVYSISRGVSAPLPGLPMCSNCFRAWNAISGSRVHRRFEHGLHLVFPWTDPAAVAEPFREMRVLLEAQLCSHRFERHPGRDQLCGFPQAQPFQPSMRTQMPVGQAVAVQRALGNLDHPGQSGCLILLTSLTS